MELSSLHESKSMNRPAIDKRQKFSSLYSTPTLPFRSALRQSTIVSPYMIILPFVQLFAPLKLHSAMLSFSSPNSNTPIPESLNPLHLHSLRPWIHSTYTHYVLESRILTFTTSGNPLYSNLHPAIPNPGILQYRNMRTRPAMRYWQIIES